jgi:hypothetical protein
VDAAAAGDADGEASYRDRAAERRDDANPDYAGSLHAAGAGPLAAAAAAPPHVAGFAVVGGGAAADSDAAGLSIEESKFMGGDVEHTHLVKGLDFALLQKVRAEQAARDGEAERERAEAQRAAATAAKAVIHSSLARTLHAFVTGAQPSGGCHARAAARSLRATQVSAA